MYMESGIGMWAKGYSPIVEQYQNYYKGLHNFVEKPVSRGGCYNDYRWEVSQGCGEGFSELLHMNSGPSVGLCGYKLDDPLDSHYEELGSAFKFSIMLSGDFRISSVDGGQAETVQSGDIWFCTGRRGEVRCVQPAEKFISGVSVGVSQGMLDAWLGGASCELSQSLEKLVEGRQERNEFIQCGAVPKARAMPGNHPIMQIAKKLYLTQRHTVCGRLRFESLALDFLCRMLMLDGPLKSRCPGNRPQRQRAVDEARNILDEEWGAPPTISSLSRRVGVNECYLKTDFRAETGLSIGAYIRKLRMEKALGLIESGRCSVMQAAAFVGYSNPSHFSRAFKRFHGRLPSSYLVRS